MPIFVLCLREDDGVKFQSIKFNEVRYNTNVLYSEAYMKYSKRTVQAHEETSWIGIDILQHKILKLLPTICLCGPRTGENYIMRVSKFVLLILLY